MNASAGGSARRSLGSPSSTDPIHFWIQEIQEATTRPGVSIRVVRLGCPPNDRVGQNSKPMPAWAPSLHWTIASQW